MPLPKARILHFGLVGHPTDSPVSDAAVQARVKEGADKARAAGYEVRLTFVEPLDFPDCLIDLQRELEAGVVDAPVIGGGVRVAPALTRQFKQTINVAKGAALGMRILFQMKPGDIYETVRRGFEG